LVVRCHAKGKAGEAPLSDLFADVSFAKSNLIYGGNFNDPYVTLCNLFVGDKSYLIQAREGLPDTHSISSGFQFFLDFLVLSILTPIIGVSI
jgi:hypothetical protein